MADNSKNDSDIKAKVAALRAAGDYLGAVGWAGLLKYPELETNWMFFRSPNTANRAPDNANVSPRKANWGPSSDLRDMLNEIRANILMEDYVPPGAMTYEEGQRLGLSRKQVDQRNGAPGEIRMNKRLTGPGGTNYGPQDFYVDGKKFTNFDGVTTKRSPWFGTTIRGNESKLGFSDSVRQAEFDGRFFAIPTDYAREHRIPGVLSHDRRTTLIASAAADQIRHGRNLGKLKAVGGLGLNAAVMPIDLYDGWQAYQQGGEPFTEWALTSGPTYAGLGLGAAFGGITGGGLAAMGGGAMAGMGVGGTVGLGPLYYFAAKKFFRDNPELALAASDPFGAGVSAGVTDPTRALPSLARPETQTPRDAVPIWPSRPLPAAFVPEAASGPPTTPFRRDTVIRVEPAGTGSATTPSGFTRLADIGRRDLADVQSADQADRLPAWAQTYFENAGKLRRGVQAAEPDPLSLPFWLVY